MLKEREQKILDYMKAEIKTKGYPPTVREICTALHIKSTSTAHKDIESLVRQGYLVKDPSKPRALMVVDPQEAFGHIPAGKAAAAPAQDAGAASVQTVPDVVEIPVVGRVAAGTPILAEQNIEEEVPLPTSLFGDRNSFLLTVHGDSMINAGIYDGDTLLVREQSTANNGDIVVAMIDDGATVKTYYKEKDCIRLQPHNDAMEPIFTRDAQILGVVTGLFRSY